MLPSNSKAQLTEDLLTKQLFIESRNSHTDSKGAIITSPAGAVGVAQFMPDTWAWLKYSGKIPDDFDINSEADQRKAHRIFMMYLYKYNYGLVQCQETLAFASYNAGIYRVKRLVSEYGDNWRQHLPKETKAYLTNLNL